MLQRSRVTEEITERLRLRSERRTETVKPGGRRTAQRKSGLKQTWAMLMAESGWWLHECALHRALNSTAAGSPVCLRREVALQEYGCHAHPGDGKPGLHFNKPAGPKEAFQVAKGSLQGRASESASSKLGTFQMATRLTEVVTE